MYSYKRNLQRFRHYIWSLFVLNLKRCSHKTAVLFHQQLEINLKYNLQDGYALLAFARSCPESGTQLVVRINCRRTQTCAYEDASRQRIVRYFTEKSWSKYLKHLNNSRLNDNTEGFLNFQSTYLSNNRILQICKA